MADKHSYFAYPYGNYLQQTAQFNRQDMEDPRKLLADQFLQTLRNLYSQNLQVQDTPQGMPTPSTQAADQSVVQNTLNGTVTPQQNSQLLGDLFRQLFAAKLAQAAQSAPTETTTMKTPPTPAEDLRQKAFVALLLDRLNKQRTLGL